MVDFPGNVKNAVNKRIADETIQQFQISEFTVSCKELNLKRAILVHESNFTLYEAEYRGSVVAVKVVAVEETQQISNYIDAVVDLTSFASLSHDNISSFLGAGYTLNSENKLREIMIVTEPYERGTLRSLLKKSLDWQTKITLARDVARAISYLHDKSVIHGDIRISTILVNDQNQAKVVDFAHLCGERSRLETRTFNTTKGTVALSPEMARNHMYDFAADVYAFGMLLFELITEIPPNKNFRYRNAHGGFALLESELRAAVKPGCPAALEALAYSCCETKALRRVVAPQIVEELDFILIELNRKPEDEVRPSPLRRTSSTTNKYAHLLLPSPSSMKQLVPAKSVAAEVKIAVSAPAAGENRGSSQQALAVIDTPALAVQEKAESEGDAAVLSVPVTKALPETSENNTTQPAGAISDNAAPVAGPSKVPQRRSALPVTPAPRVSETPSDSAGKPVVSPSSHSVPSAETYDGEMNATSAEPVGVSASSANKKNMRRKGMFDASTAQTEDEIILPPQPVKSLSLPTPATETAPDDLLGAQTSGAFPENTNNDAWLGSESESTMVKEVVEPQLESVGTSTTAPSDRNGSAVSSVPTEETPDKKKKSRTRAKIDYAAEGPALPGSAKLLPMKIVESAAEEHIDAARPPTAASFSSSGMQGESKTTTSQTEAVSVRFDLPSPVVPVSASVPTAGNPSGTTAPPAIELKSFEAAAGSTSSSPPVLSTTPPVTGTPLRAQTVEEVTKSGPKTSESQQQTPAAAAARSAPPVPDFSAPSHSPPASVLATTGPVFTELAPLQTVLPNPAPPSAVRTTPLPASVSLPPPEDTESRLFTVYAQPNFGSEYVTLNSFSQDLLSKEPLETALSQGATFVATMSMPASSPAPPLLSQFSLNSTSAAPVHGQEHGQEHAPAGSTKAVRAGAGRRAPPDSQPVPIPASIRALGEPPKEPAVPTAPVVPVIVTPVVATGKVTVETAPERKNPNIVPEPFKQHIRAIVETPERKKPVSAVDLRRAEGVEPTPFVLSTPHADKIHPTNDFTEIFSPLSPPPAAPASAPVAEVVTTTPVAAEGKVLSKKKSRSRNKLEAKTLTPIGSFMHSLSPAVTTEPNASLAVPLQAPLAPPSPQPLSVETAALFSSPAEKKDDPISPKPLNSNQKRRQNRAQARAAAAAFATVATAAQEIVEGGPIKHSASGSSSAQESPQTEKASFTSPVEAAEEPVIVYTPNYAPPPVPAVPASVSSTAVADFIAHPVEKKESAPKTEFHSPLRPSTTTHTPTTSTAAVMETPPAKLHHSPSRTPNGSLPVPAPHRHIHHFDLPSPQVTPPMHFPLAGAALLVPLPTPPESPCSPLPHKLEPAEALQTVFSDADVKIATGSPQAKAGSQATQAYSTPHRTVEKLNRFNELAAAELGSHHKTLRTKVLSPAAASQRAVLSAPAPVITVPAVNAYEERLLMMEQRLQALAEENLALQRELQVAVTRPAAAVVVQLPAAPQTADVDTATSSTMSAAHQNEVTESENETETGTETESEVDVMQSEECIADLAVPARTSARSSFGAMFRDFDEVSSEQILSTVPATQNSETMSVTHATSVPATTSFAQEVPPVSVEFVAPAPARLPPATPIGMVDALKSLEAMQTELRSQLTALNLNAPPAMGAAATATSAPSTVSFERSDDETQDIVLPADNEVRTEIAKHVQASEPVLPQVADNSAIGDSTPTKASPVDVVPLTPAPQEFTPATAAPTPSAAETEQQLQAHIASAIDSKLGAVQAQIAQFSSMLNAILLAQSPQPQRAAAEGDDASQVNCPSSTHTSAFVTPSSIMTVGSIALGMGNDEEPGGSPGGSTLGPQKLFSQIDQQSVFQEVSPLAQSCSTDSGFSEAPVLLPPSDTLQGASIVPETSSFVPNSQVIWTGLDEPFFSGSDDQRSHTLEPFSPNSNQGNDSEDALSEREESESESESEDVDEQESDDNDEETTQQAEVLKVLTHKPSFNTSTSTASEVETDIERPVMSEKEEEENTSPFAPPVAPSLPPPLPSSPASSPAARVAAPRSSPAAKSPSMKVVLEPLQEVVEPAVNHGVQHNSSNNAAVGPRLSEIIPQLMLDVEEEPLEAWEVKARRASTNTTVSAELPVQKPIHVAVASSKQSERKPSVKEASVSLTTAAVSEQAPSAIPDKIAPAEIVIPVATTGPSGRASTPESRATSPFLRNRIPYHVEAEEGTPLHFPHLFGEPEDEPVEAPPEVKSVTVEERTVETESAVPSRSDFYAPFCPSNAESPPVGLREPMAFPPPPAAEMHSPTVSVGSRSTGESSSVVDATDIEYPYSAEEYAQSRRTPPQTQLSGQPDVRRSLTQPLPPPQTQMQGSAAVQALHRHHEQQQRELLLQQEEQLQAELSVFGHHPDPSSHLIPNAHHHNVRRNPPAAFNSSSQSVQSALSAHNHHHRRSPPQPARLPSPQPSSPPLQALASSMKFLDQINRLKDHYDTKDDEQLSHVPQRKPLDYARSPSPAQVELRRPQAGPYSEKHRRVSPSSSVERIGDGYQPHSAYPASTTHAAQRLSPRSAHGAFHALRNSSPPPPLPRPLVHSDPYLAPHSYQAANSSFRSPSPPRGHSTPQQIHTQSTLTNSGGERARRQYDFANLSYPLPISPPDNEWEEEEEEEEDFVDTRNAQRLESLTGALNNFLSVIEKCTEISESADLAVSRLDHNMNRLDQRSHRKILTSAERAAEISDRRSRSRERSDSLASTGKSASFAPQLSFYEPAPPPPPSAPAALSRYNSFRNSSSRLNDDMYDAKYVDNYEDTDEDETGANQSRAGSMRPRSRSNSNVNVFDSTTNIAREPVHTKHFLSLSVKPALTQFGRADSTHSLLTSGSFRNGNITSSNSYFKAGLAAPLPPNSPGGLNIGNRSVTSKSPAAVRKPEGLPARKAAVPVQNSRKMAREDTAEPRRATRTDRATSFASTIGSVVSGLSSVGGGESARAAQRPTNFTAELRRSADSDSILIDGRVHALRPKSSQGLLSILRQDSNDSEWTNNSRGRHRSGNSRASSPTASQRSRSNSRSRSRSGSPRAMSPVEILSKNKNAPAYSFRKDASPRKAF